MICASQHADVHIHMINALLPYSYALIEKWTENKNCVFPLRTWVAHVCQQSTTICNLKPYEIGVTLLNKAHVRIHSSTRKHYTANRKTLSITFFSIKHSKERAIKMKTSQIVYTPCKRVYLALWTNNTVIVKLNVTHIQNWKHPSTTKNAHRVFCIDNLSPMTRLTWDAHEHCKLKAFIHVHHLFSLSLSDSSRR